MARVNGPKASRLLQSLSRRLGSVDPTSQLEFELGLTLLAGHPAQRNFDLSRIEMCLVTPDESPTPGAWRNCSSTSTAAKRTRPRRPREIAARFGSAFVAHSHADRRPRRRSFLMRVSRLLLHSEHFTDVDEFLEVVRRRAYAAGDVAMEGDALRLIVLSNLLQGSIERADEALRRHDELADAASRPRSSDPRSSCRARSTGRGPSAIRVE